MPDITIQVCYTAKIMALFLHWCRPLSKKNHYGDFSRKQEYYPIGSFGCQPKNVPFFKITAISQDSREGVYATPEDIVDMANECTLKI